MNCKICGSPSEKIFEKDILKTYHSAYYKCGSCFFVQTDEPVWIEEAYKSAITQLDIGLLNRNMRMINAIPKIIDACFPESKIMLDYAGGYGTFTRLMRDHGYNFYRQDPYCENLFANHFDITDLTINTFDLLTAFEVFEHFVDPLPEIEKLFKYSDSIIVSTELTPDTTQELENWWYLSTETGQHVAFYAAETMKYLAEKYHKQYYAKGRSLHVFTPKKLSSDQVDYAFHDHNYKESVFGLVKKPYDFGISRTSLIEKDYQFISEKIKASF